MPGYFSVFDDDVRDKPIDDELCDGWSENNGRSRSDDDDDDNDGL